MDFQSYKAQFEEFIEDADMSVTDNQVIKLANRSVELQREDDFSLDDIFEELLEIIPNRFQTNSDWVSLVQEIANFVFDEKENIDSDNISEE
jgi:hypothetical protein